MLSKLDRAIEAHAEEAFAFLERLVAAPSVLGTEQAALQVFEAEVQKAGLIATRLPFDNAPLNDARAGITAPLGQLSDNRFQLLATTPGDDELTVLLNGHIDVVPAESPELWASPPFTPTRRDGRMFGRGAGDMKAGFAVGVLALNALKDVAPDLFATKRLGFLAVIEEECTGNGTLRSLAEQGVTAAEVVVLEPTQGGLMVGGVGVLWLDIDVVASSAHAESSHAVANAIELGMRVVRTLQEWSATLVSTDPEPGMSPDSSPYNVNLGKVHSGDWTSTAPATATFSVRIGFPRAWTATQAEDRVRSAISAAVESDPDFPAQPTVTLSGFRASGYLLDSGSVLVRDLQRANSDVHGTTLHTFMLGSTTDARTYLNDFGIPAVCFGATAHDMHGIDESVELQSIVDAARTLARFLLIRFEGAE
ncbi:ArgE/DapE family deacylase [soil metagenome]